MEKQTESHGQKREHIKKLIISFLENGTDNCESLSKCKKCTKQKNWTEL